MTEFRIQNSEFRNDHGQPRTGCPLVFAEFCILTSDVSAVPHYPAFATLPVFLFFTVSGIPSCALITASHSSAVSGWLT